MNGVRNNCVSAMQDFVANPSVKRWRGVERAFRTMVSTRESYCPLFPATNEDALCAGCPFSLPSCRSACPRLHSCSRRTLEKFIPQLVLSCFVAIATLQAKG